MISYELCLLMRIMPKSELIAALKRVGTSIFDKGGVVRKLENLGTRNMPHKTSSHGQVHKQASYFLIEFNLPPAKLDDILDESARDVDIIRKQIYKKQFLEEKPCTLEEEMQPPPYRKSVQKLVEEARKIDKPKFNYNTGLDYYPFQK